MQRRLDMADLLNQARLWACAWFPEIVFQKVCVCLYVCMFVFPHPREQTFYLKLESSLFTIDKEPILHSCTGKLSF